MDCNGLHRLAFENRGLDGDWPAFEVWIAPENRLLLAPANYSEIYTEEKMIMNMKLILVWGIVVAVLGLLIVACIKSTIFAIIIGTALAANLIAAAIAWAVVTIIDN